ncbi:aldolase/citrate lyase family protein [Candidatus Pristimantibacillus sp. PTI5]|uniref:aldolase/citrate lyase family protein n=1 Tax=Candidatus Pristimantibacillus sp. PTI5 TaxID=3400422 RepID=UPI003B01B5F1
MTNKFSLLLFSTVPELIPPAYHAGIDGIIVDWENLGKENRQRSADTEINYFTVEDLRKVRQMTDALVICRINGFGPHSAEEVENAISAGADEILLPMVQSVSDVETVIRWVNQRCAVGILIETKASVKAAQALSQLPLSRVYVGLNDLAIERKSAHIFSAIVDGTIEKIRPYFTNIPFGFGGLTLPDSGFPIPCRLLIGELMRLNCEMSFLRRAFQADIKGKNLKQGVQDIQAALEDARNRSSEQIERDKSELFDMINLLERKGQGIQ